MRANSRFCLDAGMSTVSCAARIALRTRVRKSAIGSVIDMSACSSAPLPGRLRHPGDLTVVRQLAKADAAHPELAIHGARAPATSAASIETCFELGGPHLLDAE